MMAPMPSMIRFVPDRVRFSPAPSLPAASAFRSEIDFLTHKLAIGTPRFSPAPGFDPASLSAPIMSHESETRGPDHPRTRGRGRPDVAHGPPGRGVRPPTTDD